MSLATKLTRIAPAALLALAAAIACLGAGPVQKFRICADPDNLPYSNQKEQGLENQMARMIAQDFAMQPEYTWSTQSGKFFQRTLEARLCDVVMTVPSGMKDIGVTQPYYRSGYVFISRTQQDLHIRSLDDLRLRGLRIGVRILGDTGRYVPPVEALIGRGLVSNLVGYNVFGTSAGSDPRADLVDAVKRGDLDLAVEWGPVAGYFAHRSQIPLAVDAIDSDSLHPSLPLQFDIGIGVRLEDQALRLKLDAELERRRPEIQRLLAEYGFPQDNLREKPAARIPEAGQ